VAINVEIEVLVISLLLGIPIVIVGRAVYTRFFDPMKNVKSFFNNNRQSQLIAIHTPNGKTRFTTAEVLRNHPTYTQDEMTKIYNFSLPFNSSSESQQGNPMTMEQVNKYIDERIARPNREDYMNILSFDDGLGVLEDTESLSDDEVNRIDVFRRQNNSEPLQKELAVQPEEKEPPKKGRFESIIE